jgi:hypothetical protein
VLTHKEKKMVSSAISNECLKAIKVIERKIHFLGHEAEVEKGGY